MSLRMTSKAFGSGKPMPREHSGEGADRSPPLSWEGVPPGTAELALVCDDPDAPTPQPWVHWVLYKIPPDVRELPAGISTEEILEAPAGARQGRNAWSSGRTIGYRGPMPPPGHGVHHYRFRLYALDAPLDLPAGVDKATLLAALAGHILSEAELVGTYSR